MKNYIWPSVAPLSYSLRSSIKQMLDMQWKKIEYYPVKYSFALCVQDYPSLGGSPITRQNIQNMNLNISNIHFIIYTSLVEFERNLEELHTWMVSMEEFTFPFVLIIRVDELPFYHLECFYSVDCPSLVCKIKRTSSKVFPRIIGSNIWLSYSNAKDWLLPMHTI